jgi:hypothetical protein
MRDGRWWWILHGNLGWRRGDVRICDRRLDESHDCQWRVYANPELEGSEASLQVSSAYRKRPDTAKVYPSDFLHSDGLEPLVISTESRDMYSYLRHLQASDYLSRRKQQLPLLRVSVIPRHPVANQIKRAIPKAPSRWRVNRTLSGLLLTALRAYGPVTAEPRKLAHMQT